MLMTAIEDPYQDTIDFLRLFRPGEWLLHAISRVGGGVRSECFPVGPSQAHDAMSWAAALNATGCEIYFAINPTRAGLVNKASKEDVLSANWLWVDCDPGKDLAEDALAAWRQAKLTELLSHATVSPPTVLVDSGRGLWAFWQLTTAAPVDGRGPATARVESALAGLVEAFGGDRQAKNIDRIARLPGFINHKTGRGAFVLHSARERVYDLASFPVASVLTTAAEPFTGPQPYEAYIDDERACAAVSAYLETAAPAAVADGAGAGRTASLRVLQHCVDLGCSPSKAVELMIASSWNERCDPPWDQEDLEHELRQLPRDKPAAALHPTVTELGLEVERVRVETAAKFFERPPETEADRAEAAAIKRGFKTVNQFVGEYVPLAYTIADVLRTASLYTLTAKTGSGKTAFNVVAALAVATGRADILGRKVTRGRVAYVACENPDDVRMRFMIAAFRYGVDVREIGDRIVIRDQRVKPEQIVKEMTELAKTEPFGFVVVDTLAAFFDGKDMNDNTEAGNFIRRMRPLTQVSGNPTVLVSAHPGKNAPATSLTPYGAGSILNEVDGNLTLDKDGNVVSLHWQGKLRGLDFDPIPFAFEISTAPAIVDVDGKQVFLPVLRPSSADVVEAKMEETEAFEAVLLRFVVEKPGGSARSYAAMTGSTKYIVGARLAAFAKEKLVTHALNRWRPTPKGVKAIESGSSLKVFESTSKPAENELSWF